MCSRQGGAEGETLWMSAFLIYDCSRVHCCIELCSASFLHSNGEEPEYSDYMSGQQPERMKYYASGCRCGYITQFSQSKGHLKHAASVWGCTTPRNRKGTESHKESTGLLVRGCDTYFRWVRTEGSMSASWSIEGYTYLGLHTYEDSITHIYLMGPGLKYALLQAPQQQGFVL